MSKKGLVKKVGADGKAHFTFQDRERYDPIICETDFTPEADSKSAMFMGGPDLKILIASSNVGNAPILEMDSWVPRDAPFTDVVVFGLQESTYGGHEAPSMEGIDAATRKKLERELGQEKGQRAKEAAVAEKVVANPQDVAAAADDAEADEDEAGGGGGGAGGQRGAAAITGQAKISGSKHLLASLQRQVGSDFELLDAVMRGQMRIRVYVRKSLAGKVSGVEVGGENTGLGGVVANKGGQAVKFEINGTSLVFVNSHLAAHESAAKCNKRNEDVNEIFNGIKFGDKVHDMTQFDHTFWCGDLNYRIEPPAAKKGNKKEAAATVHKLVKKDDFDGLWAMDELQREVKAGRVYCNFRTPPCRFKPTFKVLRSNKTEYNEKRIPSYCDRILWKSQRHLEAKVQCHSFIACHQFATSDHKPVLGRFSVTPSPKLEDLPTLPPFTTAAAASPSAAASAAKRTGSKRNSSGGGSPSPKGGGGGAAGEFAFFPQLKFFDLKAHDLTAMDAGVTLQKQSTSTSFNEGSGGGGGDDDDDDDASVSGVSVATGMTRGTSTSSMTNAHVKEDFVPKTTRARGWTVGAAKSDPYITFETRPKALKVAAVPVKTEIKPQTLHPTWDATPVLSLRASTWSQVSNGTLVLTILDSDVGSEDDVIGCVEFSLAELGTAAVEGDEGVVTFKRDVVHNGRLHGYLTGKIQVNIPGPSGEFVHKGRCVDDSKTCNAVLRSPQACCTIS